MDFDAIHPFEASAEEVAAAMLDGDYQASLDGIAALKERKVLLQEERSGGTVERHIRCVLGLELPGPVKKFLGNAPPAWIEEATWYPADMRWVWVIVPEVGAELLDASGSIEVREVSAGAERRVAGRVTVKLPFYGSRVEAVIVDGVRRAYDDEASRLRSWLAGKASKGRT